MEKDKGSSKEKEVLEKELSQLVEATLRMEDELNLLDSKE